MRTLLQGSQVATLEFDPGLDEIRGEHVTGKEKLVVGLEIVEDRTQVARHVIHGGMLLRRELVDVLVDRRGRLDLVLDAVQAGQ